MIHKVSVFVLSHARVRACGHVWVYCSTLGGDNGMACRRQTHMTAFLRKHRQGISCAMLPYGLALLKDRNLT